MIDKTLPTISHIYQHHHLDSTQWDAFRPREGDVIVATSIKSGTTWMQWIVLKLLLPEQDPKSVRDISPWLDERMPNPSDVIEVLEAQKHRRSIKTHLPLDGLPYFPQVRYIVIGRDGRDVAMSLWNHYGNYTDHFYDFLNTHDGPAFPRCPETFQQFWKDWITKGWFDWEQDGYPFWSHLHFIQSWWDFRHLPNILLVHFADLLTDLEGEIQRVAEHIGVSLSATRRAEIAREVSFDTMKKDPEKYACVTRKNFRGGGDAFFNKGKNSYWKDVLTEPEIAQYEAAVVRVLSPDCARWLEHGGNASIESA
uniref:Aryl sulfotransferase n=1 Tax=Candidatus Kentrum sp. FW TaxID=2126338 RepID=A0A450SKQ2_9GAMM|nr:MAG: aryl sulfotransferase [Candidatus Kentron sp. FW]